MIKATISAGICGFVTKVSADSEDTLCRSKAIATTLSELRRICVRWMATRRSAPVSMG